MSEVNGIVRESAPPESPFQPGACFLTPALTAHLQFAHETDLHRAQELADAASDQLRDRFGIAHTTFQTECGECVDVPVVLGRRPDPHDH